MPIALVRQKCPGPLLPQQGCAYSWSLSAGAGRTSLARGAVPAGILPDVVRQTLLDERPWDVMWRAQPSMLANPSNATLQRECRPSTAQL